MATHEQASGKIICRRKERPDCGDCGMKNAGLYLCDFPIVREFASYKTCSKPLCINCTTRRRGLDFCKKHAPDERGTVHV